jgi:penicillin-binding protein activator
MKSLAAIGCAVCVLPLTLTGCSTVGNTQNPAGVAPVAVDVSKQGPVAGVGIEGHDIVAMTDQMVRDMLSTPKLAGAPKAPRVVIDPSLFDNQSSQPINKNIITQRLMVGLNRSAAGRMQFVGRKYSQAVEKERDLKRQGVTDVGTTGLTKAVYGVDYQLGGTITSQDARDQKSGLVQRYNQIVFEMVDMETQEIVWSGLYEFTRAAADDVIYR